MLIIIVIIIKIIIRILIISKNCRYLLQFKNLFEGGPDEAMMNRLNENPIKFREKFIGKVEIQGWVYLNWRALQGALGGSKLDPQVLIGTVQV